MRLWHWLTRPSDELYLPDAWLNDTARLSEYDAWTRAQQDPRSAIITADSAAMARRAFWAARAELARERRLHLVSGRFT